MYTACPVRSLAVVALLTACPAVCLGAPPRHYKSLRGHDDEVNQIVFAARANVMASFSVGGSVLLWKVPRGRRIATIKPADGEAFGRVALSADGTKVAVTTADGVNVYAIRGRKAVKLRALTGHKNDLAALCFDRSGALVLGAENGLRVWAISTGKLLRTIAPRTTFRGVAISPADGSIVGHTADGLRFYQRSSYLEERKLARPGLEKLAFSADGKWIAALERGRKLTLMTADGTVRWDKPGRAFNTAVAFSRDGKTVVTGFADDTIKGHGSAGGKLRWTVSGTSGMTVLAIGTRVMATAGSNNTVWLWRLR